MGKRLGSQAVRAAFRMQVQVLRRPSRGGGGRRRPTIGEGGFQYMFVVTIAYVIRLNARRSLLTNGRTEAVVRKLPSQTPATHLRNSLGERQPRRKG